MHNHRGRLSPFGYRGGGGLQLDIKFPVSCEFVTYIVRAKGDPREHGDAVMKPEALNKHGRRPKRRRKCYCGIMVRYQMSSGNLGRCQLVTYIIIGNS